MINDRLNLNPICIESCPQVARCAVQALMSHMLSGTPLPDAFQQAVGEARAEGLLPEECGASGPVEVPLRRRPPGAPRWTIESLDRADVTGVNDLGDTTVRVCSSEFDN